MHYSNMSQQREVMIKAPPKDYVATLTAVSKTMNEEDKANSLGRAVRAPGTLARELHSESPPDTYKDFVDGRLIRQYQKYSGGRLHFYFVFPDGSWTDTKDRALLYKQEIENDPIPDVLGDPLAPPVSSRKRKRKRSKTNVSISFNNNNGCDAGGKKHRSERRSSPKVTIHVECESDSCQSDNEFDDCD